MHDVYVAIVDVAVKGAVFLYFASNYVLIIAIDFGPNMYRVSPKKRSPTSNFDYSKMT